MFFFLTQAYFIYKTKTKMYFSTVTTVATVTTVTSVTTIVVKYQMLLLNSSKGNFFTNPSDRQTDQPTNRHIDL